MTLTDGALECMVAHAGNRQARPRGIILISGSESFEKSRGAWFRGVRADAEYFFRDVNLELDAATIVCMRLDRTAVRAVGESGVQVDFSGYRTYEAFNTKISQNHDQLAGPSYTRLCRSG